MVTVSNDKAHFSFLQLFDRGKLNIAAQTLGSPVTYTLDVITLYPKVIGSRKYPTKSIGKYKTTQF